MRLRSSLSTKILLWGFLNLAVVAGIIYFSLDLEFRIGPDSALFGRAHGRLPMLGFSLSRELEMAPPEKWDEIVKRYSEAYVVDFTLMTTDGLIVAGNREKLPQPVFRRVVSQFGEPIAQQRRVVSARTCVNGRCDSTTEVVECNGPGCGGGQSAPRRPYFKMMTSEPRLYWAGMRVPRFTHPTMGPLDMVLLGQSKSVTGNGLFLDPTPYIVMILIAMVISVLLWVPMLRHITHPLTLMTGATEKIADGVFDVKLDQDRHDEIGRLGRAINHMSDRLSRMIFGQKRFLGDAAHELASPLARMQLGIGILEESADDANRDRVLALKDEIQQMSDLVNGLLSFSRSDASSGRVNLREVNLFQVAALTVDREIPDESIDVSVSVPEDINVYADWDLMLRALGNLVRNAVRYAGTAGPIEITADADAKMARISVADHGPGVPPEMLEQIFEPFYRVESSRGRDHGGVGLGLAIVRTAVGACHGRVSAANRPEGGFVVTIELPLALFVDPASSSD